MDNTKHTPDCICAWCEVERENAATGATEEQLVRRLQNYYQQLDAHRKKREAGMLIIEAAKEIARLEAACNKWSEDETLHPRINYTERLENERNALREQMQNNPWCAACKEPDCCVSGDGTCAMIRKYLSSHNA